jgi:hypothetical protein
LEDQTAETIQKRRFYKNPSATRGASIPLAWFGEANPMGKLATYKIFDLPLIPNYELNSTYKTLKNYASCKEDSKAICFKKDPYPCKAGLGYCG